MSDTLVSPPDSLPTPSLDPAAAAPPAAETPPAFIGRFRIDGEIGRGGMGVVYQGHDPDLNRPVAVKVLLRACGPDLERRFLEEAQVAGQLQHPGVVPVHEVGRTGDGRLFFAMKLVRGRTLEELLAERPDPTADLPRYLHIFEQVCQAVAYAHSRGVLHRDLKPSNVMVGAFGEVQVMDWGLAKVLAAAPPATVEAAAPPDPVQTIRTEAGEHSADGAVLGTVRYMPPEQARGDAARLDPRSDVFGLGAILCVILTGKPPYDGPGIDVYLQTLRGDLAGATERLRRSGAAETLTRLATACLSPAAADRPAHGGAVAEAVRAYLNGVQERLRAAELAQAKAAEARKRRRVMAALATGVLAALLGAGAALWLWNASERRRQDDAGAYRARIEQVAEADERTALAEIRGDQFAGGEALLDQALQRLQGVGGRDDLRGRLEAERNRTRALREFYRLSDEAQALEFRNADRQVIRTAEQALKALGILEDENWVDHLPAADLAPAQQDRLREDAYRQLLLLAFNQAKLATIRRWDPDRADRLRAALAALGRARRFRRSYAENIIEFWCQVMLGGLAKAPPLEEREPRTATDYYFSGLMHFWLKQAPDDIITRTIIQNATGLRDAVDFAAPLQRAERDLRMAARLDTQFYNTYVWLAQVLVAEKRADAGELAANVCVALRPDYGFGYGVRAAVLFSQAELARGKPEHDGLLRRALADLDEAVRRTPRDDAISLLARAYLLDARADETDDPKAREEWRKQMFADLDEAIRVDPNSSDAYYRRGEANQERGDYARAADDYSAGLRLDPTPHWRTKRGYVRYRLKQYDDALADADEAIRLDADYAEAYNTRGLVYKDRGDFARAAEEYGNAIQRDATESVYRSNRAFVRHRLKQDDDALADGDEAIRLDGDNAEAYNTRGMVYEDKGDLTKADEEYAAAARIQPDEWAYAFNRANILRRLHKWDEAEKQYRVAIRLDDESVDTHYNFCLLLADRGEWEEAETECRRALQLKNENVNAHWELGYILQKEGKFGEAIPCFDRAVQLAPPGDKRRPRLEGAITYGRRLQDLDERLPAVLRGEVQVTAPEQTEFAWLCAEYKRHFAAAARLYTEAFARQPSLAGDTAAGHRYAAAGAAARAGLGQGQDAADLEEAECACLRDQALDWLRADLAAWDERLGKDGTNGPEIAKTLRRWQDDPALAGVRDADALDRLSADERSAWRRLWDDVAALLQKAAPRQ
jgi:tetratricopeptide (TPR) repeat protein